MILRRVGTHARNVLDAAALLSLLAMRGGRVSAGLVMSVIAKRRYSSWQGSHSCHRDSSVAILSVNWSQDSDSQGMLHEQGLSRNGTISSQQ
jgi:hypothetical protein